MSILYFLLTSILSIAFMEVIVKPLVIRYSEIFIFDILPELFDELDPYMPELIAKYESDEIKDILKYKIFKKKPNLDEEDVELIIKKFVEDYDLLINSNKIKK